ncbi:MAG: hypothetical protein KIS67_02785 [Verrucomicrobiae bacterium]|nr:hypothetical protein [Verrucomicrobiae bacterium]
MATCASQKANDEGKARHSVRAGAGLENSGAPGTDAPYRLARPFGIVAVLLGAFFLLQSWIPLRTAVQIGADEGFEVAKATLCLHGHQLYSEVWNDQPPLHTWLITQVLKFQRRSPLNMDRRLVTPTFQSARSPVGKPALPELELTSAATEPGTTDRRDALSHDHTDRRDALARNSILGPRLVTSAFTALLLVSVFLICWRISGLLVGTLTTALLLVSPGFLELSSSCMLEIPSLATALAGLCVLVVMRPGRWHATEIFCGILFGLAALMKLVPLYLLPLAPLIVWLRAVGRVTPCAPELPTPGGAHGVTRPTLPKRGWSLDRVRGSFAPTNVLESFRRLCVPVLVIGVSLAATFAAVDWLIERGAYLVHFGQSWSSHFGGVKSFEFGSPKEHVFDWNILLKNWDLTVPAVLGTSVLLTRLRNGPTAMLPPVWLALSLLVFTNHKPWWGYYYIHVAIPLCWCAAVGSEFVYTWLVQNLKAHRAERRSLTHPLTRSQKAGSAVVQRQARRAVPLRWVGIAVLLVLFALGAAGWMGARVWLQIADIRSSPQLHAALVLKEIERLRPFCRWMYTDQIVHSFHADLPLPLPLAVVPLKRLWAGDMTHARLAAEIGRFKPEIILLGNDTREVPFQDLLLTEYRLIYEDARQRLYAARTVLQRANAAE